VLTTIETVQTYTHKHTQISVAFISHACYNRTCLKIIGVDKYRD
jgi:hypothetical protein